MKKRHRRSGIPSLRKDATDEQIVLWTARHDVFDRLDAGIAEIVEDRRDLDRLLTRASSERNTAQLNMRIPPAMKAALARLARQRTTDATTLARIWLAERLQKEALDAWKRRALGERGRPARASNSPAGRS